jgi:hypothetical protein
MDYEAELRQIARLRQVLDAVMFMEEQAKALMKASEVWQKHHDAVEARKDAKEALEWGETGLVARLQPTLFTTPGEGAGTVRVEYASPDGDMAGTALTQGDWNRLMKGTGTEADGDG